MNHTRTQITPLGIIDSIGAGFSAVAQRPGLLLIPFFLDLFLWLGPRLSVTPLVPDLTARLTNLTRELGDNSAQLFSQNLTEIISSYNMFSALSTWPLGIPSLLAGNDPGTAPLGTPQAIPVGSLTAFLVWLVLLTVGGLWIGSLYLGLIARRTKNTCASPKTWGRLIWVQWARIVGLVILVLAGAFLASVPFFLLVELVNFLVAPLAPWVLLVGVGMGMWGVFHLFFAAHSILADNVSLSHAVGTSVALVQRYRFSSVGLLLIAVIINLGLSTIWNIPSSESWLRLAAIAGNAFVNTGLAAATFVFYHQRTCPTETTD